MVIPPDITQSGFTDRSLSEDKLPVINSHTLIQKEAWRVIHKRRRARKRPCNRY